MLTVRNILLFVFVVMLFSTNMVPVAAAQNEDPEWPGNSMVYYYRLTYSDCRSDNNLAIIYQNTFDVSCGYVEREPYIVQF